MFEITSHPIEEKILKHTLQKAESGACVIFEGWVRNENEGKEVLHLEYEGYEAVAMKEGQKVMAEAWERFGLQHAVCVHRVGKLDIGDIAVWVGVSTGHRAEAFDACRYIIDEVKHRLPIWKKEFYTDGDSGWVNCEQCGNPTHGHTPPA
ncbi:MAG: molybdopterin-converting factor chain 2 [Candidatus Hydrogenedentota bacterium]|nr:MAG: molybdopterin-converting factor chain 2 [Candidatus Hydrogenedentota bacterium]